MGGLLPPYEVLLLILPPSLNREIGRTDVGSLHLLRLLDGILELAAELAIDRVVDANARILLEYIQTMETRLGVAIIHLPIDESDSHDKQIKGDIALPSPPLLSL